MEGCHGRGVWKRRLGVIGRGFSSTKELEYYPEEGGRGGAVGRPVGGKVAVIALVFLE